MKYKDDDIQEWPKSWEGVKEDIQYGQEIIKIIMPFIEEMKIKKQSPKTINKHIDNLWMLGGTIIKEINYDDDLRKLPPEEMILKSIDSFEGPLIQEFTDYQQEEFDCTCRKFYKFIIKNDSKKMK